MKIDNKRSREIYELATDPRNELTNCEIAKQYGITEGAVRHHIQKWKKELHVISESKAKVANALADHACDCIQESQDILNDVKSSIRQAKEAGVSPEKLAPLYGNWIKSLELASELLGDINRTPQVNLQFNQEVAELKALYIGELCPGCKRKVQARLQEVTEANGTIN